MSKTSTKEEEIFDKIDALLEEIHEQVEQYQIDTSSDDRYQEISSLLQVIENKKHRGILQKILDQVNTLAKESYATKNHIGLVIFYELIGSNFDNTLVNYYLDRYQRLVEKEVRYLKMQAPENKFFHGVCDKAMASIANLISVRGDLDQQQKYTNVLLKEVIDYRLYTLKDETAWDFAAQSILTETQTIQ